MVYYFEIIVLAVICQLSSARGRYEFIEEADLPAFYSMRSAQMAQKAQLSPSQAIQSDYNPYYPYQYYAPEPAAPTPIAYSPMTVYSPIYRPAHMQSAQAPSPQQFAAARTAPVQYHPMTYYHGNPAQMMVPNSSAPMKKKSV